MEKIGLRVASGQSRDYQVKRANYVIDRYLLPHLGNDEIHRIIKAQFLGRMAQHVSNWRLEKEEAMIKTIMQIRDSNSLRTDRRPFQGIFQQVNT